jgi:hypothetical protein
MAIIIMVIIIIRMLGMITIDAAVGQQLLELEV